MYSKKRGTLYVAAVLVELSYRSGGGGSSSAAAVAAAVATATAAVEKLALSSPSSDRGRQK